MYISARGRMGGRAEVEQTMEAGGRRANRWKVGKL